VYGSFPCKQQLDHNHLIRAVLFDFARRHLHEHSASAGRLIDELVDKFIERPIQFHVEKQNAHVYFRPVGYGDRPAIAESFGKVSQYQAIAVHQEQLAAVRIMDGISHPLASRDDIVQILPR